MPVTPFKVKAIYEYKSAEPDDLNFPNGQIITVTEEEDDDWYSGEYVNAAGKKLEGIFPRNFVEKYEPAIPLRPTRAPKRTIQPEAQETDQAPAPGRSSSILNGAAAGPVQSSSVDTPAPAAEIIPETQTKSPPPQVQPPVSSTTPKSPPAITKPASSKPPP